MARKRLEAYGCENSDCSAAHRKTRRVEMSVAHDGRVRMLGRVGQSYGMKSGGSLTKRDRAGRL